MILFNLCINNPLLVQLNILVMDVTLRVYICRVLSYVDDLTLLCQRDVDSMKYK